MDEQQVLFAMQHIRSWLASNPLAADTVSGIHSFWIDWPEPAPSQAITLEALQRLQAEGLAEQTSMSNSKLWRRRHEILGE